MSYITTCQNDGTTIHRKLERYFPYANIVSGTGKFGDKSISLQIIVNNKYNSLYRSVINMSSDFVLYFKNQFKVFIPDRKKLAALVNLKVKCNEIKRGYYDYDDGSKVLNNTYFVCLKLSEISKISRVVYFQPGVL